MGKLGRDISHLFSDILPVSLPFENRKYRACPAFPTFLPDFRTSWDKIFNAVEDVVTWGLEHRQLGQIDAVGVDEIQYASPTLAMWYY